MKVRLIQNGFLPYMSYRVQKKEGFLGTWVTLYPKMDAYPERDGFLYDSGFLKKENAEDFMLKVIQSEQKERIKKNIKVLKTESI